MHVYVKWQEWSAGWKHSENMYIKWWLQKCKIPTYLKQSSNIFLFFSYTGSASNIMSFYFKLLKQQYDAKQIEFENNELLSKLEWL